MVIKDILGDDAAYMDALAVMDLVTQPIHIVTPDGLIRYVNKAWVSTYGLTFEEVDGRHIQSVTEVSKTFNYNLQVDDMQDPSLMDVTALTYAHLPEASTESVALKAIENKKRTFMITQTPQSRQVLVSSTPIFDDQGEVVCAFTLIQDLTLISDWQAQLNEEIRKNKLIEEELRYLREANLQSSLIGRSRAMIDLKDLISTVSKSDASILISGESGVGKEMVAKEIYAKSNRRDKPFITVNCAAIPENLLESELFGHEKGSFTGAVYNKTGLFELANGGTILLDEIGDFPLQLQPKLLRVLQEREFRRVGGTEGIPCDIRIISATNRNLLTMTQTGEFRADLYYRLNVIPIDIPPLRNRPEDIPPLISAFLEQYNKKYQKTKYFTAPAMETMERYAWPGNIRELQNIVERLVIIGANAAISAQQVSVVLGDALLMVTAEEQPSLKEATRALERKLISDALKTYKTTYKAAEALGTTQPTIVRKAQALGITDW